jgi:hypothetical protein
MLLSSPVVAMIGFAGGDLPGAFERPPGWFWKGVRSPVEPVILRLDPVHGVAAIRVPGPRHRSGVGVWELAGGRLLWAHDWADNVRLLASGDVLACADRRLARHSWPDMTRLDEVAAHEYAEELVVSPSQRLVVTWLNDGQGANGYEVFALDGGLRRLGVGEIMTLDPMYCAPAFSPSERLLACSTGADDAWWSPPEEDWPDDYAEEAEIPSPGGVTTFGSLLVHDLDRDTVSRHRLQFDLEPGWVPADVWDSRWRYGAIGLEFLAEDRLRLVLADGTAVPLRLPLPEAVLLPTPGRELPG